MKKWEQLAKLIRQEIIFHEVCNSPCSVSSEIGDIIQKFGIDQLIEENDAATVTR